MQIILASQSKARKKILEDCGFKVKVVKPKVKESHKVVKNIVFTVKRNALLKAKFVANKVKKGIIIAADTVVYQGGVIFGKPKDIDEARRMLQKLSSRPQWVYSGLAVIDKYSGKFFVNSAKTKVFMQKLSDKEIDKYFKENNPLTMAGAFDIQNDSTKYVRRIEGCFYNVAGLPLYKLFKIFSKIGVVILLLGFIPGLIGCSEFNPVTQKQEMIFYSTEKEVNIGHSIAKEVDKEYKTVKDPRVIDRVVGMADKITAVCDRRDISYIVNVLEAKEEEKVDGEDINAFSLPGGYIYVYDGLVNFVDNDDQLAGVIAHEVAHIVAKHGIKRLQAMMGSTLLGVAAMGTGDAGFASGLQYALANVMLAYSREDEMMADKLAVKYMELAGYDPNAMLTFLEKLKLKIKKDPIRARAVYRTHPYFGARIAAIKEDLKLPLTFSDYVNKATN